AGGCRASKGRRERPPFSPTGAVSQSPRLPQRGYLGFIVDEGHNPNGVASSRRCERKPQPRWGWQTIAPVTQGSAVGATLGWRTESRWDSRNGGKGCNSQIQSQQRRVARRRAGAL